LQGALHIIVNVFFFPFCPVSLLIQAPILVSETWVLSKSDENILGVFERKILRAIFGPTNENGEWRIKYNNEIYTLYKESDIVTH
jgi:hypothetical protein